MGIRFELISQIGGDYTHASCKSEESTKHFYLLSMSRQNLYGALTLIIFTSIIFSLKSTLEIAMFAANYNN